MLGSSMCPGFHFDELSFVFVRDESTIKLINTQNWVVTELVEVGEGMKYPDLQLLRVTVDRENQLTILTTKGPHNEKLVKRTYSELLKYCMQVASVKTSALAADPQRNKRTVQDVLKKQTVLQRQALMLGKIFS